MDTDIGPKTRVATVDLFARCADDTTGVSGAWAESEFVAPSRSRSPTPAAFPATPATAVASHSSVGYHSSEPLVPRPAPVWSSAHKHPLSRVSTRAREYWCDMCRTSLGASGASSWLRCEPCDYNLCLACDVESQAGVSDLPSPAHSPPTSAPPLPSSSFAPASSPPPPWSWPTGSLAPGLDLTLPASPFFASSASPAWPPAWPAPSFSLSTPTSVHTAAPSVRPACLVHSDLSRSLVQTAFARTALPAWGHPTTPASAAHARPPLGW